jgi:hypothetical protein
VKIFLVNSLVTNFYTQLPQLISGIRASIKKESAQDFATRFYVIDSDPVVAHGKTRSLLQNGKLQGYSAETQLT